MTKTKGRVKKAMTAYQKADLNTLERFVDSLSFLNMTTLFFGV